MTTIHRITRAAYLESLAEFRGFIREHCAGLPGVDAETLYNLQLAVDEACTNIVTHGYRGLDPGSIILDLDVDPDRLTLTLTDFGHSFEPDKTPVPDIQAPLEEREPGGFGLFLIQKCVDRMEYQVTEDGNKMTLIKYLGKPVGGK
jgi:serine/threonine-protein kinase RsbW